MLTDRIDSILIVIDVQRTFLDKIGPDSSRSLTNRIGWIIDRAIEFDIPIVATAEDPGEVGSTVPEVAAHFPGDTIEHGKMSFCLTAHDTILADIERHERRTAILVGLETDVCVMQSALGLLEHGFQVVVLADGTSSPGPCHEAGLARMRDAGVVVSSVKGTFYEWVRDVASMDDHPEIWTDPRPTGVHL